MRNSTRIIIGRALVRSRRRPGRYQVALYLPGSAAAEYLEQWVTKGQAEADARRLADLTGGAIEDRWLADPPPVS